LSPSASLAARIAGAVTALGYLLGIVDGPVVGVVGGLALVSFGRALVAVPGTELLGPSAFAVLAGSSGVVALRWGTLSVADIRGVQGVLGPTVLVGPAAVAVASGAALVAGIVALGLWLGGPRADHGHGRWWWVELAAGTLLLTSLFVGPSLAGAGEVGIWIAGATVIAAAAVALAHVGSSLGMRSRVGMLLLAGGAIVGSAATVGTAV
jgi:hypothetical protein